ncbi:helix-turn-helix domain-containing protein [Chachezhania sediminis]|uniref:helix-turn-helix domain-containing protein n=1 Tax=Chachezhania sediminis TaxID=2599291 RepID=UPI001E63C921|nr:helix-turn-helix domain-containing protein [Chachezhania sediminis]
MPAASFTPEIGDPLSGRPRPGHFVLDRWEVLQLVKDTSRQTGLGEREIAVLAAHLSVLPKGPVRADGLLVSYAQVAGMLGRANCMDERRFRRGEARLEELGFVTRHLSGNGRRYPVRNARGEVVEAYGIDLRPLFLRHDELVALRDEARDRTCRLEAQRSRLSARLSAVKRAAGPELTGDLATLAVRLRNLLRRASAGMAELLEAEEQLLAATSAGQEHATPAASEPGTVPALPDISSADAGQIDRHSDSKRKEIYKASSDAGALSPAVWSDYAEIAAFFPDTPRTEVEVQRIILDFSGFVGIREGTVRQVLAALGPRRLLSALNTIAAKICQIRNPNGYLLAYAQNRSGAL